LFLIVPISLIVISLAGIFFIFFRKKSYLSDLAVSQGTNGGVKSDTWTELFFSFFPEIDSGLRRMKLKEHIAVWLLEIEKYLRKARLIFLRIDRLSDGLIKKIRKFHLTHKAGEELSGVSTGSIEGELPSVAPVKRKEEQSQLDAFRKEEQRLILEIAKNPKDPGLYEVLGDMYMKTDNLTDAKESYEAAIELSPQNDFIKEKLSLVLEKMHTQA